MRVELNLGDQVVVIDLETAGVLQINGRMASSLQPCKSQPAVRSCPALFQVTPRCGSRCPSVIQLALVYPGTHPESCGAAPRLQGEAIDLPATENMVQDRLDLLHREIVLILRSLGNLGSVFSRSLKASTDSP